MSKKDARDLIRKAETNLERAEGKLDGSEDAVESDAEDIIDRIVDILQELNEDLKPDDQVSLNQVERVEEELD